MRLKMDDDGELYETDPRYNGERGFSRKPELVEAGNVQSISTKEDAQTKKDRVKIIRANETAVANKQAAVARRQKDTAKAQQRFSKQADRICNIQKELRKLALMKKNAPVEQAIMQNCQEFEQMGGVSGYAYSADGRVPYADHPAQDYVFIEQATEAFGGFMDFKFTGQDALLQEIKRIAALQTAPEEPRILVKPTSSVVYPPITDPYRYGTTTVTPPKTSEPSIASNIIVGPFSKLAMQSGSVPGVIKAAPSKSVTVIPDKPASQAIEAKAQASAFSHPLLALGFLAKING